MEGAGFNNSPPIEWEAVFVMGLNEGWQHEVPLSSPSPQGEEGKSTREKGN